MATVLKVLGQATLGTTLTNDLLTVYSGGGSVVPTGKALLVKNVRFVNKDTSTKRTATLNYVPANNTGNSRALSPAAFSLVPGGVVVIDDEFVLVATDALKVSFGETTGGNIIDVVVTGIERDQS